MRKYPNLFTPVTIRGFTFKNRILATPIQSSGTTKDGCITEKGVWFFGERAKGGAAVVTVGEAAVNNDYAIRLGQTTDLTHFDFGKADDFRRYTYEIKRHGAIPSIQLCHGGFESNPRNAKDEPMLPIGPSPYTRPVMSRPGKNGGVSKETLTSLEMTKEQIRKTVQDFADCAVTAKAYGFQMVQLHGGHGWLFSQFASKLLNTRIDEYGGSTENRARFAIEVLDAIRQRAGEDFLIEYRISWDEMLEGGNGLEETIEHLKCIEDKIDIAHITVGTHWVFEQCNQIFPLWFTQHGLNVAAAGQIKKALTKCKVAVVGGIDDPAMAEEIVATGKADFVAMCRGLVADPHWPNKALDGRDDEIIPCIRCISCHDMMGSDGAFCTVNPKTLQEYWLRDVLPAKIPRRVVVLGGGVAGLSAAITARQRGHEVILLEKEQSLGGIIRFTDNPTVKKDMNGYKNYLIHMIEKLGVDMRLGIEATPEFVKLLEPYAVLAAVGSSPIVPRIEGVEKTVSALWAYGNQDKLGKKVVIIGGNLTGVELAIDLAAGGHDVAIIEMLDEIAAGAPPFYMYGVQEELDRYADKLDIKTGVECTAVLDNAVTIKDTNGSETQVEADAVICAVGMRSNSQLADSFSDCCLYFRKIGDCDKVARIKQAVAAGYHAANEIN